MTKPRGMRKPHAHSFLGYYYSYGVRIRGAWPGEQS